ncbi:MAG: phosphate signaling complex protein PhoU [Bdellovibrionales bacterium]|nr:phosphate signaling complex protein PhoU [Oligoflexia bacterium]
MQRQIDIELNALRSVMLAMGVAVEKAVEAATSGLIERNAEHLDKVRALEDEINAYHLQVDEKCLKLIASQSPLAADLRMILAIIKINADLERMGDQAMNISYNVRDYLTKKELPDAARRIVSMAHAVKKMVRASMEAFINHDIKLSEQVLLMDDEVDEGKNSTFKDLVVVMKNDPESVDAAVDLMLVSRNLERLGDHATNIAEDVIFASTGKDIRHGGFNPGSKT